MQQATYVRLYADENGESHFEELEISLAPVDFAPPAAPNAAPRPDTTGPEHRMRTLTRRVAFERTWTRDDAAFVSSLFDSMAEGWTASHDVADRYEPLTDALHRADLGGGICVELGSGTGLGTRHLHERFDSLVTLDLALEMLRNAPADLSGRVQGDSSRLPIRSGAADVVVLVNMILFPNEIDRVLAPGGSLVWVNTMAERTPIHLSAEEVHDALPGDWAVVHSRAGSGLWATAVRE